MKQHTTHVALVDGSVNSQCL